MEYQLITEDTGFCPLLDNPDKYNPDTLDLIEDFDARNYWLNCFENQVNKYVNFAIQSGVGDPTVTTRAEQFKTCYLEALEKIRKDPLCFGSLSIRLLLDLNKSCLQSQGFPDLWEAQKALENDAALDRLKGRLDEIDAIEDQDAKWTELSRGLLAGNMFDWGARAISDILESNANFGLREALDKIQRRPWLVDGLDDWLNRLKGSPHHCSAIFVDNSGVDVVLGVLPFVRQLLLRSTDVIMCANSEPALNDTTCSELAALVARAARHCPVLAAAQRDGRLVVMRNGQKGPCLDLTTLDKELCSAMRMRKVDLVIIEGMGRALHTNLSTKFKCESLKMAVVKNSWLARRLGGDIFSVICKYEQERDLLT